MKKSNNVHLREYSRLNVINTFPTAWLDEPFPKIWMRFVYDAVLLRIGMGIGAAGGVIAGTSDPF